MYTKIIALVIQTYLVSKASSPPSQNVPTKKVMSTEGLAGLIVGKLMPKSTIILVTIQALIYIYVMYRQEIGSTPILPTKNHKFSSWNLLEVVFFVCAIGGTSLRLWCFNCLEKYFTFNVTVKKDHKLITTGPYSLLVHPSYTGGILMINNIVFLWYQLCSYVPAYFPYGLFGSFIWLFGWWNIVIQTIFLGLVYRRVFYEEMTLKRHFDKEWDAYFSQRKRFIPYVF